MEENKYSESLSVLLLSRTFDSLYLQFYHSETNQLTAKKYFATSAHTSLSLEMPLSKVHIKVKTDEHSLHIMHQFRLEGQSNDMGNYVKIKKKFPNFQLLFNIFYKPSSNIHQFQSQTLTRQDLNNNNIQKILSMPQSYPQQPSLIYLKQIARSNLTLLTSKALTKVFATPHNKNIYLPLQQPITRPFRKGQDKQIFTYNARIKKLQKNQALKNYVEKTGFKIKNRSCIEQMVNKVGVKFFLGQQGCKIWGKKEKRGAGNAFILFKKKKKDMLNNDYISCQTTKKSQSHNLQSCNKITLPKTSLSITDQCQQPPSPLSNQLSYLPPIPQQPNLNKFSRSLHQNIVEHSFCQNQSELEDFKASGDILFYYQQKEKKNLKEVNIKNLYENLRLLCGGKVGSRERNMIRPGSQTRSGSFKMSRSQQISSQSTKFNPIKDCLNLTKPYNQLQLPLKAQKFKQHYYQNLQMKTLQSIQNQTKILQYAKAHCETLNSVSIQRLIWQKPVIVKGKQNFNGICEGITKLGKKNLIMGIEEKKRFR